MILRIAICEDETNQIQERSQSIDAVSSKYPNFRIIQDVYRSGNDLVDYYERADKAEYYDIIFFDVDLGDSDGIETAIKLRKFDKRVLLIYITQYPKRINDAAETFMFRYLVKPVPQHKFNEVFDDAINYINVREKAFTYTFQYNHYREYIRDIKYFERVGLNVRMHTTDEEKAEHILPSFRHQITKIHDDLKDYGFIMIHSSILVNLAYVREVNRTYLVLRDKTQLNISRANSRDVHDKFLDFKYEGCAL